MRMADEGAKLIKSFTYFEAMSLIFKDQMERTVEMTSRPKKIVSLVPSQTELLFDLGLDEEVNGITKFCIHPEAWRHSKTIVGGTKKLNHDIIRELSPDLIIGNKEENNQQDIQKLMEHYPVWMSDIENLDDALDMIGSVGSITGKETKAEVMKRNITDSFKSLSEIHGNKKQVLYLVWYNPWMAAGRNTFINDMLDRCGFQNILESRRYPEMTADDLAKYHPQTVLLSSEPYPFSQKHADEIQRIYPEAKVYFVDGEMFSWYGSRLLKAVPYFTQFHARIQAGY
jgi:ABC-type Fe3+-hydroxamate transport system substrate-binding protein